MKLNNYPLYPYCPEWDKFLQKILKEGKIIDVSEHHIRFKLKVGVKKRPWFLPNTNVYSVYDIWVANLGCSFGRLHRRDGKTAPDVVLRLPSQETAQKLYKIYSNLYVKGFYEN